MQSQRQRDTIPERALRSALHRSGFRFRVDHKLPGLRRRADIVFPGPRVAVFVDGCFWHGCPEHGTWPKANSEWWRAKIEANRARDADTNEILRAGGWAVVRVWEHEPAANAAERVADAVCARSHCPRTTRD
jgi:DNA mismatch endonuclease (patch repair protein)